MSKGSGGGGTQVSRDEPSTVAAPFISGLYGDARNLYNTGGPEVFTGRTFAEPSQNTLNAEQLSILNALGPQALTAQNLTNAQNFALAGPANLASNPFLAGATEAALRPLYSQTQGLLQQARRDSGRAGQLGSDRQAILEQGVIGDYLTKAGDITSKMYSDAYNQALQNQTRALALAPTSLAAMNVPAQTLMGVGAAQEARDQLAIDDARRVFEAQQARPFENLQQYASILGSGDAMGRTMTQTMQGQDPSFGQRALGGAAAGIGTAAALGSTAFTGLGPTAAAIGGYATPIGWAVGIGSALGLFD